MKPIKNNQPQKSNIDALLALDPDKITSPALRAAIEQHQEEKKKEEAQKALAVITALQNSINIQIRTVRVLRKREKVAVERLKKTNAAQDKFLQNGDVDELRKTLHEIEIHNVG